MYIHIYSLYIYIYINKYVCNIYIYIYMCVYKMFFLCCFKTPLRSLEVENPSFSVSRGFEEQAERRKQNQQKTC